MKDFKDTNTYQALNETLAQATANAVKTPNSVDHLQHVLKGQAMVRQSAEATQVRKFR